MIKFFRKIRQKMLTENKFSKYLLYAIGEIVLVVIGILIALQINNWNNDKEQRKLEAKYLNEIQNNLRADLSDIVFNINFNESKLKSNKIVLDYLQGNIEYSDSLEFHMSNLFLSTRTLVNTSAFESLKSRGLEIISNDSLRQRITTLYEFTFYNAIDFETKDVQELQYHILIPEVKDNLNITEFKPVKGNPNGRATPINKEMLLNNHSFKNALMMSHTLRSYLISIYKNLKISVEKCIKQIEIELNE